MWPHPPCGVHTATARQFVAMFHQVQLPKDWVPKQLRDGAHVSKHWHLQQDVAPIHMVCHATWASLPSTEQVKLLMEATAVAEH